MKLGWSVTRARKTAMFIFALCVVPILFVTRVGDWAAVFLIGLAGSAHQAWSANLYSTASDMFPQHAVGSLIGLGSAAGSTAGMIFPLFCGFMLDKFTAAGNVTAGYNVLFLICAFAYLMAFGLNHPCAPVPIGQKHWSVRSGRQLRRREAGWRAAGSERPVHKQNNDELDSARALWLSTPALPPLATTFCSGKPETGHSRIRTPEEILD
jgi:MFS family permease